MSQAAAVEVTRKNKKKFSEAVEEMRELADFLKKFATEMSKKDAEIQAQIRSA